MNQTRLCRLQDGCIVTMLQGRLELAGRIKLPFRPYEGRVLSLNYASKIDKRAGILLSIPKEAVTPKAAPNFWTFTMRDSGPTSVKHGCTDNEASQTCQVASFCYFTISNATGGWVNTFVLTGLT